MMTRCIEPDIEQKSDATQDLGWVRKNEQVVVLQNEEADERPQIVLSPALEVIESHDLLCFLSSFLFSSWPLVKHLHAIYFRTTPLLRPTTLFPLLFSHLIPAPRITTTHCMWGSNSAVVCSQIPLQQTVQQQNRPLHSPTCYPEFHYPPPRP